MAHVSRRHVLQFAGSALASIGLSQLDILRQSNTLAQASQRYGRMLAQRHGQKLALLVGINDYDPSKAGWNPLRGCVNDVWMQKELLMRRFGFAEENIKVVINQDATHKGILDAFQEHLIDQAGPDDVVVFHYSGHGSRVIDPNPYRDINGSPENQFNSTFVPIDSPLPPNFSVAGGEVNDIMGRTLFLLMLALKTEKVSVILDSCHSGGGKRGAVVVRARDGADDVPNALHPATAELDFQAELQAKVRKSLGLTDDEIEQLRRENIAKGVVIASAAENQYAVDANFSGVRAGAFTYLLTQYLWQLRTDDGFGRTFVDIDRATRVLASNRSRLQEPDLEANVPPALDNAPIYFTEAQAPAAEAVVTEVNGDEVTLWMGGVHPLSLPAFSPGTIFEAIAPDGKSLGLVELTALVDGLQAKGKLLEQTRAAVSTETYLQERVRMVPQELSLRVGLDQSLGNETAIAQSKFTRSDKFESVDGEDENADYIFARMTSRLRRQQATPIRESIENGSLGLLLSDLSVVPGSFGPSGELMEEAIARLRPTLKRLLATCIIRTIVNPTSSQLKLTTALKVVGSDIASEPIALDVRGTRGTSKDNSDAPIPVTTPMDASRLPLDTVIQIEVTNNESRFSDGLYVSIIAIDPDGSMTLLFPANNWTAPDSAALVPPQTTLRVPDEDRGDRFRIRLQEPLGVTEILVLASSVPLRSTLAALGEVANASALRGDDVNADITGHLLMDQAEIIRGRRGVELESTDEDIPADAIRGGISSQRLAAWAFTFEVYDPALEG